MPKFRSDTGKYLTLQLFYDAYTPGDQRNQSQDCIYTLRDDIPGFINFGKRYVQLMDKTGYKVSKELLEDYNHFQRLERTTWFSKFRVEWDRQIDAILEKEALDIVRSIAKDKDNKGQLAAARLLLDYSSSKPKRGRPSKEEISRNLKQESDEAQTLREDAERLRLVK